MMNAAHKRAIEMFIVHAINYRWRWKKPLKLSGLDRELINSIRRG